jgi:hypothetical protein
MPIEKEFGKLTAEQLLLAIQLMPTIDAVQSQIRKLFEDNPGVIAELAPRGFHWAGAYELSFNELVVRVVQLIGKSDFLAMAAEADDPQQAVLDGLASSDSFENASLESSLVGDRHTFAYFIGLIWALMNNIECVALYGRYINELVAQARSGDPERDKALLNAIRVDSSVVAGETAARRISTAQVMDDQEFLAGLRRAMEGKTGDQAGYLRKFRTAIKMLSETGGLGDSPTALARRLVELGIYPLGPVAVKNAAELIRKAKKFNAI